MYYKMLNEIVFDFQNGFIYRQWKKYNTYKKLGWKRSDGYIALKYEGKDFLYHRFLYENFYNITLRPEQQINHINHKRNDNRIDNLEIVNNQQNTQYQQMRKSNTSNFKGVSFNKQCEMWEAYIHLDNKKLYLGHFSTPEEASNAYIKKALDLNNQGHKYFIPDYFTKK